MFANRRLPWVVLAACVAAALFAFGYPLYVIRPYRPQGVEELTLALALRSWSPTIAAGAAILALLLSALLWRTAQRTAVKAIAAFAALLTVACAVLTHVNVYEIMFHRIDTPQTMPISEAKLDAGDMVLAGHVGTEARAYPIRMIAYHHIVNDRLGGLPIVSTY